MNILDLQKLPVAEDEAGLLLSGCSAMSAYCTATEVQEKAV